MSKVSFYYELYLVNVVVYVYVLILLGPIMLIFIGIYWCLVRNCL